MKKVNVLWFLLESLFLILFNLLFFMFVEERTTPVWISYGFIHFAYALLLATPLLVRRGSASYTYSRALYGVTAAYFLVELAVGVALILAFPDKLLITLITQAVLAAIFIAWLIANMIANEHTADNVERREADLKYVKEASSHLNAILQRIDDKAAAKTVQKAYDLIHSSPIKSDHSVYSVEKEILDEIGRLDGAVSGGPEQIGPIADNIYRLAGDRNRRLKLIG